METALTPQNETMHPVDASGHTVLLISLPSRSASELRDHLLRCGCTVIDAAADQVLAITKSRQPDLALLDASGTASPDGEAALRATEKLKTNPYTGNTPLIVLLEDTVSEDMQLKLLQQGADECLLRPASTELFYARLRAICQRYAAPGEHLDTLRAGSLSLDTRARKVFVGEKTVLLTRKEFDLLSTLLRKRGTVVYTAHLYHTVWGYGESAPVDSHTVKVHISSLRGKIGREAGSKIVNLPGLGYRFDD